MLSAIKKMQMCWVQTILMPLIWPLYTCSRDFLLPPCLFLSPLCLQCPCSVPVLYSSHKSSVTQAAEILCQMTLSWHARMPASKFHGSLPCSKDNSVSVSETGEKLHSKTVKVPFRRPSANLRWLIKTNSQILQCYKTFCMERKSRNENFTQRLFRFKVFT